QRGLRAGAQLRPHAVQGRTELAADPVHRRPGISGTVRHSAPLLGRRWQSSGRSESHPREGSHLEARDRLHRTWRASAGDGISYGSRGTDRGIVEDRGIAVNAKHALSPAKKTGIIRRMDGTQLRVGLGHDTHRLAPNRPLILGGVPIEFDRGLLGHSDADILLHAVTDAILGGAGLGDIGDAFPDTDPAYAGIDSAVLLQRALQRVVAAGWRIVNLDCTIFAQRPKLAPY